MKFYIRRGSLTHKNGAGSMYGTIIGDFNGKIVLAWVDTPLYASILTEQQADSFLLQNNYKTYRKEEIKE
jgi:hypothetical protein